MIPGVISLHVRDNQPSVLIMSMYHNRPGHVYSLGEPFVVPLNRRRPACYDTRSYATTERPMIQQPMKRAAARRGVGTSIYPRLSHSMDNERPMQRPNYRRCNDRTDDATTKLPTMQQQSKRSVARRGVGTSIYPRLMPRRRILTAWGITK